MKTISARYKVWLDHSWRGQVTLLKSLKDGLDKFLGARARRPDDDSYCTSVTTSWTNEMVLISVLGIRGAKERNPAAFDAVSSKYGVKCETFEQAWRCCCPAYNSHGARDWRDIDIEALRECDPAFAVLELPSWVEEAILDRRIEEELARQHGEIDAPHEAYDDFSGGL